MWLAVLTSSDRSPTSELGPPANTSQPISSLGSWSAVTIPSGSLAMPLSDRAAGAIPVVRLVVVFLLFTNGPSPYSSENEKPSSMKLLAKVGM